jgi:two-component system nitrate/nitrite sensor histidine kinase NarX
MRSRIRWGGLRTKIIAWSLLPTAVILGAVALFTYYTYQRVTEELVIERNQEITRLLSDALAAEFLEVYSSQLGDLLMLPEFDETDPFAQRALLQNSLDRLMAFDGGVVILDAAGTVVASDPRRPDAVGQDWSDRPYYRRMMESPGVILSDILPDGPKGENLVALAVPIWNRQGMIVGMFSLASSTTENGLLRSANRVLGGLDRQREQVYLVDGNGRVILYRGSFEMRIGENRTGEEAVQRVLVGETNSLRTRDRDGREIIASFSPLNPSTMPRNASTLEGAPIEKRHLSQQKTDPIPGQLSMVSFSPARSSSRLTESLTATRNLIPLSYQKTDRAARPAAVPEHGMVTTSWGLIIEESWAEVTRTSRLYGRWLLGLLVLAAVVPAAVITVGARQITQPIARLADVAQEVAGGDLDQEIAVKTGDELEELAGQFNHMSAQLRVSYATLEQRVADRTRELATLNAIAGVVSRSLELEQILHAALDKTMEATGMEVGAAYRLEEDGETMALIAHRGLSETLVSYLNQLPLGASAAGRAAREERPVVLAVSDYPESTLKELLEAEGLKMAVSVPLVAKGETLGAISLGSSIVRDVPPEESSLLAAIGQQTGVAVENARLYEHAEESAAAAERNRLARDLHDAVTQTLFSAGLIAEVLPRIWERKPDEGRRRLDELRELTRGALAEMRTLLLELRPSALVEVPLGDLLRQLAESITGRARVPVAVEMEGDCTLPVEVKVALYRIAQEALNNIAKHAGASWASVSLQCRTEDVTLQVQDDGRGFDASDISPQSLGVGIMRERAQAIGAELKIESAPGEGTLIAVIWARDE